MGSCAGYRTQHSTSMMWNDYPGMAKAVPQLAGAAYGDAIRPSWAGTWAAAARSTKGGLALIRRGSRRRDAAELRGDLGGSAAAASARIVGASA